LHDRKSAKKSAEKPEPKSGTLSHEKPESRNALFYQPHRAKGVRFRDTRGGVVQVTDSGAVRNLTKPRSRVKRLREQRQRAAQDKRKQKEAGQKEPSRSN
jgi:hypothetical protein